MLTLSIMTFSIIGTPDLKHILLRSQDLLIEITKTHIEIHHVGAGPCVKALFNSL